MGIEEYTNTKNMGFENQTHKEKLNYILEFSTAYILFFPLMASNKIYNFVKKIEHKIKKEKEKYNPLNLMDFIVKIFGMQNHINPSYQYKKTKNQYVISNKN